MASLIANGISRFSPQSSLETNKTLKGFLPRVVTVKTLSSKLPNSKLLKIRADVGYESKTITSIQIHSQVKNPTARVEHEASTSKIGANQLFYFKQRGIDQDKALVAMVSGFCRDVFQKLPDEFSSEVKELMSLKLEGSVG